VVLLVVVVVVVVVVFLDFRRVDVSLYSFRFFSAARLRFV